MGWKQGKQGLQLAGYSQLERRSLWNSALFEACRTGTLLQSKDYQVSVQTKLIANIANMYYTLLMLDKQMELVTDMEKLTKDTWDIMVLQKDAIVGVRSTAVQRAEANYYSVLTQKGRYQATDT